MELNLPRYESEAYQQVCELEERETYSCTIDFIVKHADEDEAVEDD